MGQPFGFLSAVKAEIVPEVDPFDFAQGKL
jgi:hypothetical protein